MVEFLSSSSHICGMEKRNTVKLPRSSVTGEFVDRSILGVTRDGIVIRKSPGRATHFTDKELREAVRAAISARVARERVQRSPKEA